MSEYSLKIGFEKTNNRVRENKLSCSPSNMKLEKSHLYHYFLSY